MSLVRDEDGKRLHVKSRLMGESLVGREFLEKLEVAQAQSASGQKGITHKQMMTKLRKRINAG